MSAVDQETTRASFRPGDLEIGPNGAGHLVGSRCGACEAHYYPRREVCARCTSENMESVALSTTGTLYTYTVIHQSTPDFTVPYVLGYVDLPEGVRVLGQVVLDEQADVRIGMLLAMSVEPFGEDDTGNPVYGYRFREAREDIVDD